MSGDAVASTGNPSSAIIFAVGPLTALPPMIGDTAMTGARQAATRRAPRACSG